MSKSSMLAVLATVTVATLFAGCTTAGPIRDLADQGAASVGLAEASLRQYLAATNAQLGARMELLRYEAEELARDRAARELDLLLDERAGVLPLDAGTKLIRSLGDERRKLREQLAAEIEIIIRETLPDPESLATVPAEKLATARKSFSVLSDELSPKEWISLYADYAREIRDGIKLLKEPATDAAP